MSRVARPAASVRRRSKRKLLITASCSRREVAGYQLIEKEHAKLVRAREKKLAETKAETGEKISAEKLEIDRQAAEARSAIGIDAEKLADQIAAGVLKG